MNNIFSRFSIQDQVHFIKRLSFLIESGVPVVEGLTMLKSQMKSRARRKVLEQALADVSSGKSLATSLGRSKGSFGILAVNLIRVGELGGILSQNLSYLADELEKKQALKRKIIGALIYPAIVACTTIGITVFIIGYIFPKVIPIFRSLNATLPPTTQFLFMVGNFLRSYGLWVAAGVVALCIFIALITRIKIIRLHAAKVLLKVPISGTIQQSYCLTNSCRMLGLLLRSNARVIEAFRITAESTPNSAYRREFLIIAEEIEKGDKISSHLAKSPNLFPEMVPQMIAVGERTGNLSTAFLHLAQLYENEVDNMTKNLANSLEPVLMIFMGLVVGFVAFSIITPIYEFTKSIHK